MKLIVLCLSVSLSSGCASLLIGAQIADLGTTRMVIHAGKGHEANPIMPEAFWQQAVIKAVSTTGALYLFHAIEQRGHTQLARVLSLAMAGSLGVISVRNWRIARGR